MTLRSRIWLWWNGYCTKHLAMKNPYNSHFAPTRRMCLTCADDYDRARYADQAAKNRKREERLGRKADEQTAKLLADHQRVLEIRKEAVTRKGTSAFPL